MSEPSQPFPISDDPASAAAEMEFAHVLFMDIVGYSLLPMDRQTQLLSRLQQIVSGTARYRKAQSANQLIGLPTGDGMALVFFGDPVAPVECAVAVAQELRDIPEIRLRMGLHSGPVYRMADINANRNVAGGGINMAQRVMDCGDAGHILLSRHMAETLLQLSAWAPHLHDLGEQTVKHGVRVHIYNLYTEQAGNPELPSKFAAASAAEATRTSLASSKASKGTLIGVVGAVAILIATGLWYAMTRESSLPATASSPATGRIFSYSILVQRYQNGQPFREPFVVPGEMIFQQDYHIRLLISSPQPGNLYVLNEGPESSGGEPSYNILFPGRDESALVSAGASVQIPPGEGNWFVFDAQEGVEKLWLVWSAEAHPLFERAKAFGDAEHLGVVSDAALVRQIHGFLSEQLTSPPSSERDEENQKTNVSGNGNILAKLVRLEHH